MADTLGMAKSESRFGFGQLAGSVGVALLGLSVSQPWLQLDIAKAFSEALNGKGLDTTTAGQIAFAATSGPLATIQDSPQVEALATQLGVGATGWDQDKYLAAAILAAALIALIGVLRSVFANSAWGARSNAPLLALSGLGSLAVAGVQLWVLAPEPKAAMEPALGMWLIVGGAACLLLGALTLGNNRRRPWIDDFENQAPAKAFDNTEHLAYSHGAWVPRVPDDDR